MTLQRLVYITIGLLCLGLAISMAALSAYKFSSSQSGATRTEVVETVDGGDGEAPDMASAAVPFSQLLEESRSRLIAELAAAIEKYRCEPGTAGELACLKARADLYEQRALREAETVRQRYLTYQHLIDDKSREVVPGYTEKAGRLREIRFALTVDEAYEPGEGRELTAEHNRLAEELKFAEAIAYEHPEAANHREAVRRAIDDYISGQDPQLLDRLARLASTVAPVPEERFDGLADDSKTHRACNFEDVGAWHQARDRVIVSDAGIRQRADDLMQRIDERMKALGFAGDDYYRNAIANLEQRIGALSAGSEERYRLLTKYYELPTEWANWRWATWRVVLQKQEIQDSVDTIEQLLSEAVCRSTRSSRLPASSGESGESGHPRSSGSSPAKTRATPQAISMPTLR